MKNYWTECFYICSTNLVPKKHQLIGVLIQRIFETLAVTSSNSFVSFLLKLSRDPNRRAQDDRRIFLFFRGNKGEGVRRWMKKKKHKFA